MATSGTAPCAANAAYLCTKKECKICLENSMAGESVKADMARVKVQLLHAAAGTSSASMREIPKRSNVLATFLCLVCLAALPHGVRNVVHVYQNRR